MPSDYNTALCLCVYVRDKGSKCINEIASIHYDMSDSENFNKHATAMRRKEIIKTIHMSSGFVIQK